MPSGLKQFMAWVSPSFRDMSTKPDVDIRFRSFALCTQDNFTISSSTCSTSFSSLTSPKPVASISSQAPSSTSLTATSRSGLVLFLLQKAQKVSSHCSPDPLTKSYFERQVRVWRGYSIISCRTTGGRRPWNLSNA